MPNVPLDPLTFDFFARFVLTGFLIYLIRSAYAVGERPRISEIALDIALFSLLNQLVWQLLTWVTPAAIDMLRGLSTSPVLFTGLGLPERLAFFREVLGLPVLLGILAGRALRSGWQRSLLRRLAMPVVDPLPRAYDHVFANRGVGFVIVTYRDGTQVYGYYGPNSRAGRDPARSELYLERIYLV